MRIDQFTFGSIRIDGVVYEHDVVIARGRVRKRKKKPSKPFREGSRYGTPRGELPPIPDDPATSPGPEWEWRPETVPEGTNGLGAWVRRYPDGTREYLAPDLEHGPPQGPHWDWRDRFEGRFRVYPPGMW